VEGETAESGALNPRVPPDQIEEVRSGTNPFSFTKENVEKGKALFQGKAFCITYHGIDGRGYSDIPGLVGKLPRNFTDKP
jgi:hypothetical protein